MALIAAAAQESADADPSSSRTDGDSDSHGSPDHVDA